MKPLSVTTRLTILIVLAVAFGATMIALSVRTRSFDRSTNSVLGDDKKIERTFPVKSDGTLYLDSDVGNISVVGTDKEELEVRVVATGSDEQLRKFDVSFDQTGNDVKVKGELKRKHFGWFGDNWLDIQFEIRVPSSYNLSLRTSGGNIEIENVKGKINGETSGGNLDFTGLNGDVSMSTSGGNVTIKKSDGNFKLETSGGNMIAESITGPLHMETSGGNIDITGLDGKVDASTSGGNVHASLKSNKGVDLSTSGGNISVKLPKTVTAHVKAEASGGDVTCDLEFSGRIKDGTMNGKINGGGELIKLETSGGDIIINSNE